MNTSKKPHFLVMHKYHMSRAVARQAVILSLQAAGVKEPTEGWDTLQITWNENEGTGPSSFPELIAEARAFGIVKPLQRYLDKADSIFGSTMDEIATPNWQMKLGTTYAGFSKEVEGPCRCAQVERDLTQDILHYRQEICDFSDQHDFRLLSRAFRSYLLACVSLIDAFINRHVLIAEYDGFKSPEFEELKVATNTERRVRLWFEVCSDDDPSPFFASPEWCHFQELRKKRNEIVHALDPFGMYSLREVQLFVNKVRTGVGGVLWLMRRAHKKPTLGFIERLRTAPVVDLMKIIFKADGNHEITRISGK